MDFFSGDENVLGLGGGDDCTTCEYTKKGTQLWTLRDNAMAGARMHAKSFRSYPTLATLWTVACQAPLSMGFSRQEYWSELSCPPPGYLPNPGTEASLYVSCIGRCVL